MKRNILVILLLILGSAFYVMNFTMRGELLSNRGNPGQLCYPNSTCEGTLTCFQIRDNLICEEKIEPVDTRTRSCFGIKDSEDQCYFTRTECLTEFSRRLAQTGDVTRGCGL